MEWLFLFFFSGALVFWLAVLLAGFWFIGYVVYLMFKNLAEKP